jgi:hypothetical protein
LATLFSLGVIAGDFFASLLLCFDLLMIRLLVSDFQIGFGGDQWPGPPSAVPTGGTRSGRRPRSGDIHHDQHHSDSSRCLCAGAHSARFVRGTRLSGQAMIADAVPANHFSMLPDEQTANPGQRTLEVISRQRRDSKTQTATIEPDLADVTFRPTEPRVVQEPDSQTT